MKNIVFILLCLITLKTSAEIPDTGKKTQTSTIKNNITEVPDTVEHLHSKTWTWIPPTALVGYGFASFVIKPVRNVDYYFKMRIARSDPNYNS
ncbi:MAG: hypothetical protein JO080_12920, partial [Mucilaginibacter sp.]|nr:hypothetical protein [Mucilaginibacter sp.]